MNFINFIIGGEMKRKIAYLLICILFFSNIVGAVSYIKKPIKTLDKMNSYMDYTHTVFVEVGTAQNCEPCHFWNQNMYNTYNSGVYDFGYVEMIVFDHNGQKLNQDAFNWLQNYSISSFPTSIFDGDYQRIVGNNSQLLPDTLNNCGNRAVADITAVMTVAWLGAATIQVDITIENNGGTQYNGHIRACITEIISRYDTYYGAPYHFGFLDYAFDKDITINAGGLYTDSVTWDGNEHYDAHGNDFGDIAPQNIQLIMGVINANNGYVDETVAARVAANYPPMFSNENPPDGSSNVPISISSLSVYISDPDGDSFDWTIETSPDIGSSSGTGESNGTKYCSISGLNYGTTYTWYVNATDTGGSGLTTAEVNTFTTESATNNPPYAPSNPSPPNGATNVDIDADLSWTGGDPDPGDTVTYDVYFGTTSPPPMVSSNQSSTSYNPGTMNLDTLYYWKIVAWDNHGASTPGPIWSFTTGSNDPPYTPSNPSPPNGATNVDIYTDLSWTGGDPNPGDTVLYDIYFGTESPPPLVHTNSPDTTYDPGAMLFQQIYYWQIEAEDSHGESTMGPEWNFTTGSNDPPYTPSNPSPPNGAINVDINADLSWTGGDPNSGDTLTYDVYFEADDSTPDELVSSGQTPTFYNPGTMNYDKTYYWKIVAWDNHGASTPGPIWSFTTEEESEPELELTITFPKRIFIGKICVLIKNTGETDATDVNWEINLTAGIRMKDYSADGTIKLIEKNKNEKVCTGRCLGRSAIKLKFGKLSGTVTASVGEYNTMIDFSGFIFGRLIFIRKYGLPENKNPTADAGGPYFGVVDEEIIFDGSGSSDPDGIVVDYHWDFNNDGTYDTEWLKSATASHSYSNAGEFTVKLEVKDDDNSTDIDIVDVIIIPLNTPPNPPIVSGDNIGHVNVDYLYKAVSTDPDNHFISYVFDWDDGTNTTTEYLPNSNIVNAIHKWATAGIYNMWVYAIDDYNNGNGTPSGPTYFTVVIDALFVKNIGYLLDEDCNVMYDSFYSNDTGCETHIDILPNGNYLINSDTDAEWDYIYDSETDTLTVYGSPKEIKDENNTPWFILIIVIIILLYILIITTIYVIYKY